MKTEQLELLPPRRVQLSPDEPAAPKGVVGSDAYKQVEAGRSSSLLKGAQADTMKAMRVKLTNEVVSGSERVMSRNASALALKKMIGDARQGPQPTEGDDGRARSAWKSCRAEPPWCTGFWEVNSREYKKPFDRIWFDKVLDGWVMPDSGQLIKSADMHLHYRGLTQAAQDYDYFVPGMNGLDQVLATNKPKRVVLL